jgi:AcrR family transcriptional regulator
MSREPALHAHGATTEPRTRILDAAELIVRRAGVAALTLEAAAREAGVSKGGLLYHFGSKETLLAGLLQRLAAFVVADFEAGIAAQPPGPGQVARAMLEWAVGIPQAEMEERCDRAAAVFLAAFHHDPALLDPMRRVIAEMRLRVAADGLPEGHGTAIMAAGDGLFMARIFGLYTLSAKERTAVGAALARLIVPAEAATTTAAAAQ